MFQCLFFLQKKIVGVDIFSFCYSGAHLLDFKNGKSTKWKENLEYISKFSDSRYLVYLDKEKRVCRSADPIEAYQYLIDNSLDIESFDFINILSESFEEYDLPNELQNSWKSLLNQEFEMNLPLYTENQKGRIEYTNRKELMSFKEWVSEYAKYLNSFFSDDKTYRYIRRYIKQTEPVKVLDPLSTRFNEEFEQSEFKKTFLDFVKEAFKNTKKEPDRHDIFTTAYLCLNLLNIDEERTSKSIFQNTRTDGEHSFYAAHCDILVSNDVQLRKKSQILYKLFNLDTLVLSWDEFKKRINFCINQREKTALDFLKLVRYELENPFIVKTKQHLDSYRYSEVSRTSSCIAGYFNRLQIDTIQDTGCTNLIFFRNVKSYSNTIYFNEIESIVNYFVLLFGVDLIEQGFFVKKEENKILDKSWAGRCWKFEDIEIELSSSSKALLTLSINNIC